MKLNIIEKIKKFIKELDDFRKLRASSVRNNDDIQARLQKNFLKPEQPENNDQSDFIKSKNQSMKDSQGVSDFSGSSYNGPGNVDREKRNSNMSQRNF